MFGLPELIQRVDRVVLLLQPCPEFDHGVFRRVHGRPVTLAAEPMRLIRQHVSEHRAPLAGNRWDGQRDGLPDDPDCVWIIDIFVRMLDEYIGVA